MGQPFFRQPFLWASRFKKRLARETMVIFCSSSTLYYKRNGRKKLSSLALTLSSSSNVMLMQQQPHPLPRWLVSSTCADLLATFGQAGAVFSHLLSPVLGGSSEYIELSQHGQTGRASVAGLEQGGQFADPFLEFYPLDRSVGEKERF